MVEEREGGGGVCCQGHIDFGSSNRLLSMDCGPGESRKEVCIHKLTLGGCVWVFSKSRPRQRCGGDNISVCWHDISPTYKEPVLFEKATWLYVLQLINLFAFIPPGSFTLFNLFVATDTYGNTVLNIRDHPQRQRSVYILWSSQ